MIITKKISEHNELYLYMNGKLIYKKWLNTGQSKVFDVMAYDKYTYASYTDLDIKDSPHIIYAKARIRLKTTEEGGRTQGITSGYRPNHVFEYRENGQFKNTYIGELQFAEEGLIELGKDCEVRVKFALMAGIEQFMEVGRKWYLHELNRHVGNAEILSFEQPMIKIGEHEE